MDLGFFEEALNGSDSLVRILIKHCILWLMDLPYLFVKVELAKQTKIISPMFRYSGDTYSHKVTEVHPL